MNAMLTDDKPVKVENERTHAEKDRCKHPMVLYGICLDCVAPVKVEKEGFQKLV